MATTLQGSIQLSISLNYQNTNDQGAVSQAVSKNYIQALADGTGLNQAQVLWFDTRTTDDTGESLDFATGGGLTNIFGTAIALSKIKAVIVVAAAANTLGTIVSRPATTGGGFFDADADATTLRPGGWFVWTAPDATAVAVAAGDTDQIKIAASASGNVAYDIWIIGI